MRNLAIASSLIVLFSCLSLVSHSQQGREQLDQIEQALKADVPRILCLSKDFATGGQPTEQAFSKLAANGFRSVLNLRTASEGVDTEKERTLVEKAGMRYINIPVISSAPQPEQVKEFIKVVKDKTIHPMMIHCASANRVGAFWMIYRVLEEGWAEDKALEEAIRIGLKNPELKKFAESYIAQHKTSKT